MEGVSMNEGMDVTIGEISGETNVVLRIQGFLAYGATGSKYQGWV